MIYPIEMTRFSHYDPSGSFPMPRHSILQGFYIGSQMPKITNVKLDTWSKRSKLAPRPGPYWFTFQTGRSIGYRRIKGKAGTWVARWYDANANPSLQYHPLGAADDVVEADDNTTLSHDQAQAKAHLWFAVLANPPPAPLPIVKVADVLDAYVVAYRAKGGKAEKDMTRVIDAHIRPRFGGIEVENLTSKDVASWRDELATAPARLRGGKKAGKARQVKETPDSKKADKEFVENAQRARRSTANRVLTVLKAALNHAFAHGDIPSDHAWRSVKPFPGVDAPKVRYLSDEDAVKLVAECPADLRQMVSAALLTGADYSELATAKVRAFDQTKQLLTVRGKRGTRDIHLSQEAEDFFAGQVQGKKGDALMFTHDDGEAWGKNHQSRPLRAACVRAGLDVRNTFHILRHAYATRMLRNGMPMHQVAKQIGHKSIRITEKHYAHVIPSDVASSVRNLSGTMGLAAA